jgi:hypothetical protein
MIHVRYEYTFSQAVLDERRSVCAPYIMYGYRAQAWPRRYGPTPKEMLYSEYTTKLVSSDTTHSRNLTTITLTVI